MVKTALPLALALAFVLVPAAGALGQAAAPPAARTKEAAVRELIELTGAASMGTQMVDQMIAGLRQSTPGLPPGFWERFRAKVRPEEMAELVVPIYQKHFTLEEVEALIAFYQSPVGRKTIAAMPAIMAESMAAGQAWGQRIGEQAAREIEAETAKTPGKTPDGAAKPR